MATPKGNLTAQMAILGLLAQRPGSAVHIRARLEQEYPEAKWSRAIAYKNTSNLAAQGLLELVQKGAKKSEDIYELTEDGLHALRGWAAEVAQEPPPTRDAMLLWMEHASESEIPALLEALEVREEKAWRARDAAHMQLKQERRRGMFGPADGSDFRGFMRYLVQSQRVTALGDRVDYIKATIQKIKQRGQPGLLLEEPDEG